MRIQISKSQQFYWISGNTAMWEIFHVNNLHLTLSAGSELKHICLKGSVNLIVPYLIILADEILYSENSNFGLGFCLIFLIKRFKYGILESFFTYYWTGIDIAHFPNKFQSSSQNNLNFIKQIGWRTDMAMIIVLFEKRIPKQYDKFWRPFLPEIPSIVHSRF